MSSNPLYNSSNDPQRLPDYLNQEDEELIDEPTSEDEPLQDENTETDSTRQTAGDQTEPTIQDTTIEKLRNSPEIHEMTVKPQLNSRK